MNEKIQKLRGFLDNAKSVYHSTHQLKERLEGEGYQCLLESESWNLQPGGKYYLTRGGSALIAFRIPQRENICDWALSLTAA